MISKTSHKTSVGKLAATVVEVDGDAVWISASDGRRWGVSRADFPAHLTREGQPISLLHDERGFVTEVETRARGDISPELQERLLTVQDWISSPIPSTTSQA